MSKVWSECLVRTMVLGLSLAFSSAAQAALTDPQGSAAEDSDGKKKKDAENKGWHREGFGFTNGKSEIRLAGYAQWDFRKFNWEPKETDLGPLREPERELRRFRLGIKGELDRVSFEFVMDPRKSQVGDRLKDATLGYRFSKELNLLAGHFKPEVSPDFLTSSSKTDFTERSMAGDRLVPDREWGVALSGDIGPVFYGVGAYRGDGSSALERSGTSGAARVTVEVKDGLVIGGSFMQGRVTADPKIGSREPLPKGGQGRTHSGFNFWERAHVQGTRRRLGGDATLSRGSFQIVGEYLELQEQRLGQGSTGQDIPDVRGRGWRVQASFLLTGEEKTTTITPSKSVFQGGKGALEIAARVDGLKFDDTGDPAGFAGYGNRARNIAPSGATALSLGLNYWASNFLKFQGCALWEGYNDPLIAPVPGDRGRYLTLVGRIQVMVP